MSESLLLAEIFPGVLELRLNRPARHNAFDGALMEALLVALKDAENEPRIRAIVLTGQGKSFCAGGDIDTMRSFLHQGFADNLAEAKKLASLFAALTGLTKPLIARVNGPAIGGGVGLVAACDIVVASQKAFFSLGEVKLGLSPSVISPYVMGRIGLAQARRYFLTGEKMDATTALRLGLVNEVVPHDQLHAAVDTCLKTLRSCSPAAIKAIKELIRANITLAPEQLREFTCEQIARLRISEEAQEGMQAFFEKRPPSWCLPT